MFTPKLRSIFFIAVLVLDQKCVITIFQEKDLTRPRLLSKDFD